MRVTGVRQSMVVVRQVHFCPVFHPLTEESHRLQPFLLFSGKKLFSFSLSHSSLCLLSCSCLPDLREDEDPPCTAENKEVIERQCNVLKSDKFEVCHSLVNPDDFIEICIYDMCQYDGMKSALCDIVQVYVDTCKNHGITIKWRNSTFCRKYTSERTKPE